MNFKTLTIFCFVLFALSAAAPAMCDDSPAVQSTPDAPDASGVGDVSASDPADPAEEAAESSMEGNEGRISADAGIQVQDAVVCHDVVNREPVGSGDIFAKEVPRVFCFSRVVGAVGETAITHNWYHEGNLKASVQLPVRSSNWRTWSAKSIAPEWTGEWMVEILGADGIPLESLVFFIQ